MQLGDAALDGIKRHLVIANLIASRLNTVSIPGGVGTIEKFLILGE
jgi:hypothetical protein